MDCSDGGLHWKFRYGGTRLADYWPASGRGQVVGQKVSIACPSVAQAQKLAIVAKRKLFCEIANALQGRQLEAENGHSALRGE